MKHAFAGALVLKIPPETLAKIPFELEPVLHVAWLVGLIPTLAGLGRIIAGTLIEEGHETRLLRYESAKILANRLGPRVPDRVLDVLAAVGLPERRAVLSAKRRSPIRRGRSRAALGAVCGRGTRLRAGTRRHRRPEKATGRGCRHPRPVACARPANDHCLGL